jgi:xylulokinase
LPLFLGLDLGTSSLKAVLIDEHGTVAGRGEAAYPLHTPQPGFAEQDPQDWWRAAGQASRQALAEAGSHAEIAAVGLSGQMHGTVLLDEKDVLLAPAVIWPDQRSGSQVAEITSLVGAERLIQITGSPVATGFVAATSRWFQQQQSQVWRQVRRLLLPKDYLRRRMTGEFASDPSDGSGSLLLDVRTRDWSDEILDTLEIDRRMLPAISLVSLAGRLFHSGWTPRPARRTAVVTGTATPPGLLGSGATGPGDLLLNLSTGGRLVLPSPDGEPKAHAHLSALEPGQPGRLFGWAPPSPPGSLRGCATVFLTSGERCLRCMVPGQSRRRREQEACSSSPTFPASAPR